MGKEERKRGDSVMNKRKKRAFVIMIVVGAFVILLGFAEIRFEHFERSIVSFAFGSFCLIYALWMKKRKDREVIV